MDASSVIGYEPSFIMEVKGLKIRKFSGRYEDYFGWKDDFEAAAVILGFHKLLEASINENTGFILLPGRQSTNTVDYSTLQNNLGSFIQEQVQEHLEQYLIPNNLEKTPKISPPNTTADTQHDVGKSVHTQEGGRNRSPRDSTTSPELRRFGSIGFEKPSADDDFQGRRNVSESAQNRYSGAPKRVDEEYPSSAPNKRSVDFISAGKIRSQIPSQVSGEQKLQGTTQPVPTQGRTTHPQKSSESFISIKETSDKMEQAQKGHITLEMEEQGAKSDIDSTLNNILNSFASKTEIITDNIVEFVTDYVAQLVKVQINHKLSSNSSIIPI